jgi:hypothetical protein
MVIFEVLTAMKVSMLVFWFVTPEEGDSMYLRNASIGGSKYLQNVGQFLRD